MKTPNWQHTRIVKEISEKLDVHPRVVASVLNRFFLAVRSIMLKNGEINLKGYFKLYLRPKFKNMVEKDPDINLRVRKDIKRYPQKD